MMTRPDTCSLFPYWPGSDHLAAIHADEFERLRRAIRAGNGFRFLLAQYNLHYYRDLIVDRLKTVCERSLVLHVDRENPPDFNSLQQRLAELTADAGVLHVLGLEAWDRDPETDWLPSLNAHRENLARQCPLPMVIWLPGRLIRLLAIHAADMWSWRSGVFDFSVRAEVDAPKLVKPEPDFVPPPEKERRRGRINELAAYLKSRPDLSEALRASLLNEQGELHESLGELDEAMGCFEEALALFRSIQNESNIAETQGKIADILAARGDLDEALRIRRQELLPVFEQLGDVRSRAVTQRKIADILEAKGDLDQALQILKEDALPSAEKLGAIADIAVFKGRIADILEACGDLDEALRIRREEELPVYERLGDVRSRAVTQRKIADILEAKGDLDQALQILKEDALPAAEKLGAIRDIAVFKGKIADILQARGDLDEALRIYKEERLPAAEKLGDLRGLLITRAKIGMTYLQLKPPRRDEANTLLCQALADARRMNIPEANQIRMILMSNGMTCDDDDGPAPDDLLAMLKGLVGGSD